jgi:hypothetical protein
MTSQEGAQKYGQAKILEIVTQQKKPYIFQEKKNQLASSRGLGNGTHGSGDQIIS